MSWILIAGLAILGVGVVWLVYSLVWGTPPSIHLAVERLALRMVLADPELLTQLGLLDNTPLDFHSGRLTDVSPRANVDRRRLDREGLALIRRYRPERLTGQKWVTHHLMRWYFEQNCAATALITIGQPVRSLWDPTRLTMCAACKWICCNSSAPTTK
jgi:hypothetical protein